MSCELKMLREDRAAEAGTYAAAAARLPGKKKNCKKLIYFGKGMYWIYEIWKTFDCLYSGRAAGDICIFTAAHRICERMEQVGNDIRWWTEPPIHGVLARGIDLSYWNQNVDWNQVAVTM